MSIDADRIASLYELHAKNYDTDRDRSLGVEQTWLDRFVSLLPPHASILDIGCGHGEPIAQCLIGNGFGVQGIDTSPTLIALCHKRFPLHRWLVEDMRMLCLGRAFQGLIAWDSFFHLAPDDQRQMFSIFRSHAQPGAVLMFTSGPSHGESIGSYRGEPLYHASLSAAEYTKLLETNGFSVTAHATEDPDAGLHTVWLAQLRL